MLYAVEPSKQASNTAIPKYHTPRLNGLEGVGAEFNWKLGRASFGDFLRLVVWVVLVVLAVLAGVVWCW